MANIGNQEQNFINNGVDIFDSLVKREKAKRKDNLFFLAISFFALSIMLVVVVLNTYVFFIAHVSGNSMVPTLNNDDKLIANRYKEPTVGDIVTIRVGDVLWIKRVIAMGGDTVELKNGDVYVNGQLKDEPYLNGVKTYPNAKNKITKWQLKDDEIFFMGDNRGASDDARAHGPCKVDDVVGVIESWSLWLNDKF